MSRTVLQVPMSAQLRKSAEDEALRQGFSSLQDLTRLFFKKLADKAIRVTLEESIALSPPAIRRYNNMSDEIQTGKVKTVSFSDIGSLIKYLNK